MRSKRKTLMYLVAELIPRQETRVPVYEEIVHSRAWLCVLAPHSHVETGETLLRDGRGTDTE